MERNQDVVIVGAGLAGLCCAITLTGAGKSVTLLEASDAPGGRIRTDVVEGFRLDRGFQVLLTAYPALSRFLDLDALQLRPFVPGALVRTGGRFCRVSDPLRAPHHVFSTLLAPVGSLRDKWNILGFRKAVCEGTLEELFSRPETTALQALRGFGFGEAMIERFFRPFFGGIFLETELQTSSRMLEFVFRMFSSGDTAIPALGMQAIPEQLAASLPEGCLRLNERAQLVEPGRVRLASGNSLEAAEVVIAVDGETASNWIPDFSSVPFRSVTNLYFEAPAPAVKEGVLLLNGEGKGPINNLHFAEQVSAALSPDSRSLVSVSVVDPGAQEAPTLQGDVEAQLSQWFGEQTRQWKHLRTYRVKRALPAQPVGTLEPFQRDCFVTDGLWVCGDHRDQASIQGAMDSGRRVAEAILKRS